MKQRQTNEVGRGTKDERVTRKVASEGDGAPQNSNQDYSCTHNGILADEECTPGAYPRSRSLCCVSRQYNADEVHRCSSGDAAREVRAVHSEQPTSTGGAQPEEDR
ncbi:hypothetical protein D4764_21G0006530 [Takifugu flavidus]|uniref:Uncharacterized protein n=1 Tax=Takifugu flavidus TaxID=433684 RepID=A0A5C6NF03_9TELE|nr:hypothetical protein D4764_21G0006530 [Takifugu flavidus]